MHKITQEYLQSMKVDAQQTKKLFVIGLIGLTGVGKSYVADIIASKLNLYVANSDKIRRFLNNKGIEGDNPRPDLVKEMGEASSKFLLGKGVSHIIDADLVNFYKATKKTNEDNGAKFFLMKIFCSEDINLERIRQRNKDNNDNNFARADEAEYYVRKSMHDKVDVAQEDIFFEMNTAEDVEKQVDKLIKMLIKEKVI